MSVQFSGDGQAPDHTRLTDQSRGADRGPTKTLTALAAGLTYADLDNVTRRKLKSHILDSIGVCLAGGQEDVSRIAASVMADVAAPGDVPVPGLARRSDVLTAAFLAGTAGHGLELDDGFRPGGVHPGCVVIPTALAVGHMENPNGARFLSAVAAGYEVAARIAALVHPRPRWRGFHNTATIGVFAAAATTAQLKGFDQPTLEHAFGLAASCSSGIRSYVRGGDVKRIHPGIAARDGILCALLAARGHKGAEDVLEGKDGFLNAFAGDDSAFSNGEVLEAGGHHNARFAVADCYIKPHACCRHLHPGIDALIDILFAEGLAPGDIESIDVETYRVAATHGEVGWDTMTTAQMSYPYALAVAAQERAVHLNSFHDAGRQDAEILRHCQKVRVTVDDELDEAYPKRRPARVVVTTVAGARHMRQVDEPLGSATNPLPEDKLIEKFHALADPVIGADRAGEVEQGVWQMDGLVEVRPFIESLAPQESG